MSTPTFDQENVFGDDDDTTQESFAHVAAGAPAPAKAKGKTIAGLSIGLWAMIFGVVALMAFAASRILGGGGGDEQVDGMADPSMSLEQPAQAELDVAAEPTTEESVEPVFVGAQVEPVAQPVINPDAAALATQPGTTTSQAQSPVAVTAADPLAAARLARLAPEPASPTIVAAAQPAAAIPVAAPAPVVQAAGGASSNEVAQLRAEVASLQLQVAELRKHQPSQVATAPAARPARSPAPKARNSASATAKPPRVADSPAQQAKASGPVAGVSLRAVVGDSAWVQTTAGESIQVRNGDVIPGVGTVKGINAESAQVQLDDGRVLK